MAVHSAWPPLTCLAMFVIIVGFLIVKYGDRLLCARSVPLERGSYDYGDDASINTVSCLYDERDSVRGSVREQDQEKGSMRDFVEVMEMPDITVEPHRLEKYEYAV